VQRVITCGTAGTDATGPAFRKYFASIAVTRTCGWRQSAAAWGIAAPRGDRHGAHCPRPRAREPGANTGRGVRRLRWSGAVRSTSRCRNETLTALMPPRRLS